jgi:hypothetical protein
MGASAASAVIETLGARLEASDKQLFERAEEVYENILRL